MRSDPPGICVDPSRDSNTEHGRMEMVKHLMRSGNEIILVSVSKGTIAHVESAVHRWIGSNKTDRRTDERRYVFVSETVSKVNNCSLPGYNTVQSNM